MKPTYFWLVLALISLSLTVNLIYAKSQQLDRPVFLDHYISKTAYDQTFVQFYYLTNKDDSSGVSGLSINGVDSYINSPHMIYSENLSETNIQTFTHHALRMVEVVFDTDSLTEKLKDGPFSFKEVDISFSDRGIFTAPIGEVFIHPPTGGNDILSFTQGGGSSDYSYQFLKASEPIRIDMINFPFETDLNKDIELKVATNVSVPLEWSDSWSSIPGTDVQKLDYPIEVKEVDQLRLYTRVKSNFKAFVESEISISGTTATGIPFKSQGSFLNHLQLTQQDVKEIIQSKNGRSADE